jgi:methylenetetrahydrofolate dehydrogenase (NADP+) / methenyltetrahydrofolate cyclohydrolase
MILIDGRKIQKEILSKVQAGVNALDFQPIFSDILVGEDSASAQYVRMKARVAESVGIRFEHAVFPSSITTRELVQEIKRLNKIENMCGIIVQLPLPSGLDSREVLDSIDPRLDVDCLGTLGSDKFYNGDGKISFPTALACLTLLDSLKLDLSDKRVVVLGQGELVGRPVAALLRSRGIEPYTLTSDTPNKEEIIKQADIIISAIGKGKFITGDMIKNGVVLIDAGTSESGSGLAGDVDLESVKDKAQFVSPVPGGVGPVTVAMLMRNLLEVARGHKSEK